jgi:hypothetical protein
MHGKRETTALQAVVFYLSETTCSIPKPLQPHKQAVSTNRPNLSELKTGLHPATKLDKAF